MIKMEFTQEIKAPVEKVFAFVTDFSNVPQWQTGVIEASQSPQGPTQVGTKIRMVRTLLGRHLEAGGEVTEFIPNQRCAFKSVSGPMQFSMVQTFESVEGNTRIHLQIELEAGGFFKLAEGVLVGNLKKEFEAQAAKLKTVLES
jgi:uncharacterized membrane protein